MRQALHNTIDDHRVIKYSSKTPDTADALAKLDADPGNPNSVILIYSRRSEAISNFGTTSGWNREHLWCNSYGIDKRGPAYSDLHNLKPADASVNSARSNKIYDNSDIKDAKYQKPGHPEAKLTSEDSDSWEPPTDVRGEIARAAFYMDVRYSGDKANENDLQLTNELGLINAGRGTWRNCGPRCARGGIGRHATLRWLCPKGVKVRVLSSAPFFLGFSYFSKNPC